MTEPTLCVAARCPCLIAEHLPDCTRGERCRGCLPRQAAAGQLVCTACTLRLGDRLTELPQLWDDLLTPTTTIAAGPTDPDRSDDTTTRPDGIPAGADALPDTLRVRSQIRSALVGWAVILLEDHQHPLPDDTVHAITAHVRRHRHQLLAGEHAARFADEIDQLWTEGRRYAYPAAPPGQKLGNCPDCNTPVRADHALAEAARCRGCGAIRALDDWRDVIAGELATEAAATSPQLAAWLSARYGRPITDTTIRKWASRGIRRPDRTLLTLTRSLNPDDPPDPDDDTAPHGRWPDGRTRYRVSEAGQIGELLYGQARG